MNKELDLFAYSISHDLRAFLSSVLGLINVMHTTENMSDIRKYLGMMTDRVHAAIKPMVEAFNCWWKIMAKELIRCIISAFLICFFVPMKHQKVRALVFIL